MEAAQEWLARAIKLDPDDALVLYNVACVYTQLGEYEKALECLESSYFTAGSLGALSWVENDPDLDPLRESPRFKALIAKLKGSELAAE